VERDNAIFNFLYVVQRDRLLSALTVYTLSIQPTLTDYLAFILNPIAC